MALWPSAGYGLLILGVFRDQTRRHTTVGRTPLDEWSARRRHLCLTTHNIHSRRTPMPPAGLEPTISAGERSQTHALDRSATGTGLICGFFCLFLFLAQHPLVGQGLIIHEVSRSHTTTHHNRKDSSGWEISPSQRPLPVNTQHSQQTDIHAAGGIRTHNFRRRTVADLRLRPRGHFLKIARFYTVWK